MSAVASWRVALLVAALSACAAPRPTEFVNVTYTPSVDTSHYATWDFELSECRGFGDPRVKDELIGPLMLDAIREELERQGYAWRPDRPVDFLVHYELWIADSGGAEALSERGRGRIVVKDVATGRPVWRGERKAAITRAGSDEERRESVRLFVHELLQYTRKLSNAE